MAPVPFRDTKIGELETLLVTDAVAVALPATCGANMICTVTLWPIPTIAGKARPTMVKLPFEMLTCDTVTLADPELVSVKLWLALDPTGTLPKATVKGFAERIPAGGFGEVEFALVKPEQPDKPEAIAIKPAIINASLRVLPWQIARDPDNGLDGCKRISIA